MASESKSTTVTTGSIEFFGLLTLLLIYLKLSGTADISWAWIAAAFLGPIAVLLAILLVSLVVAFSIWMVCLTHDWYVDRNR